MSPRQKVSSPRSSRSTLAKVSLFDVDVMKTVTGANNAGFISAVKTENMFYIKSWIDYIDLATWIEAWNLVCKNNNFKLIHLLLAHQPNGVFRKQDIHLQSSPDIKEILKIYNYAVISVEERESFLEDRSEDSSASTEEFPPVSDQENAVKERFLPYLSSIRPLISDLLKSLDGANQEIVIAQTKIAELCDFLSHMLDVSERFYDSKSVMPFHFFYLFPIDYKVELFQITFDYQQPTKASTYFELIVINRDDQSDPLDPRTWGDMAYVIDQNQHIHSAAYPLYSSVLNSLETTELSLTCLNNNNVFDIDYYLPPTMAYTNLRREFNKIWLEIREKIQHIQRDLDCFENSSDPKPVEAEAKEGTKMVVKMR